MGKTVIAETNGFILAAGFGKRLKQMTHETPKPLVRVCGVSLIELAIRKLESIGIKNIYINVHFQREKIIKELSQLSLSDVNVHILEEDEILGTAGAFKNLICNHWDLNSILAINSDIVFDFSLENLMELSSKKADLELILWGINSFHQNALNFNIDTNHSVKRIEYVTTSTNCEQDSLYGYSGIQWLSRKTLNSIQKYGFFDLVDFWKCRIQNKEKIFLHPQKGFWSDIGTPKEYYRCNMRLLKDSQLFQNLGLQEIHKNTPQYDQIHHPIGVSLVSKSIAAKNLQVQNSIVEHQVDIGSNVSLNNSIILTGAKVESNQTYSNCVAGKNFLWKF